MHTEAAGKVIRGKIPTLPGNYLDYFDAVYNAIRNKADVPVAIEDARDVVKIIELAHKSSLEKRALSFE